jgi:hypothetical protein
MYDNTITLAGDASSSQSYALTAFGDRKTVRRDSSLGLGLPKDLTISHSESKVDGKLYDRHLVRLDRVLMDEEGDAVTISAYVVIVTPREIATAAQAKDQITQLKNFLITSGYVDKLLNSEP